MSRATFCLGMTALCAERSSTAFSTQDDLDGVVDLARHRDGDDRRSSAIAAVGGLTGDRRCADDADQADSIAALSAEPLKEGSRSPARLRNLSSP